MAGKDTGLNLNITPQTDPKSGVAVAVDLGGTKLRAALSDSAGKILVRAAIPTEADKGLQHVLDNMEQLVKTVVEQADYAKLIGLGIGAPGPLNPMTGVVYSPPNLPGWDNVPLRDIMEERTGLPVFLGNDANLAALGEYSFGAGKDYKYLVYITISTGVGGGVIENGKLLLGARGGAAELGHMTIEARGPRCNCGNFGCLEALASGTAIRRRAIEALEASATHSSLRDATGGNLQAITTELISKAAEASDSFARELLRETGFYLGVGLTNVLHLYNPEIVVLGGGVSQIGDIIFEPMRRTVSERAMPAFREGVPIVVTELGDEIGLYGGLAIVISEQEEAARRKANLHSPV